MFAVVTRTDSHQPKMRLHIIALLTTLSIAVVALPFLSLLLPSTLVKLANLRFLAMCGSSSARTRSAASIVCRRRCLVTADV